MQYEQTELQPTLIWTQPWKLAGPLGRQMAGEALEFEEALGGERVAGEELGELVDLAGTERDVDEREPGEHLLLDRLGPAAADADHAVRMLALESLGLAEMGDEACCRPPPGSSRC